MSVKPYTALFLAAALSCTAQGQPATSIARVLLTRGNVEAIASTGARTIQRRSELFPGESIVTGSNSFVQLRMVDGAIIALREDTEFEFTEYRYDGDPNTPDRARLRLIRGGFRTITGSVGNSNNDLYALTNPFADVTVRGTTYACAIAFDTLHCGVYDGGITVKNPAGEVDLGLGGNWDYVEVAAATIPPAPLLTRPTALGPLQPSTSPLPASFPATSGRNATATNGGAQNNQPLLPTIRNNPAPTGSPATFPAPAPIQVSPQKKNAP